MPLADILKALVGVDQPAPGAPQAPGTVTSKDIYTPGVESLISAVPALIGSYEQGRGKPIGNVLSTLGQFGLTNAANRQKQHEDEGDVAARIESLASRGLAPNQGTLDAVNQMTPAAADKELSDVEASQQRIQERQQTRQEAEADKIRALQYQKPYTDGHGQAWVFDPNGQRVRAPQFDKLAGDAKTKSQLLINGINTGNMAPYHAFVANETADAVNKVSAERVGTFHSMLTAQLKSLPLAAIPALKGLRPINLDTLSIGKPKDGVEAFDPDKYAWTDAKTATETIPQIKGMVSATRDLAGYTKGMPKATDSTAWNLVNTTANGLGIKIAARGGSPQERAFMANRIRLALMMQKVLTTSSRPLNLVEYNRVTGEATGLSAEGEALIPTTTDTRESASLKEQGLTGMARDKFRDLGLDSPASHYYGGLVRDSAAAAMSAPMPAEAPEPATVETPDTGDDTGWETH